MGFGYVFWTRFLRELLTLVEIKKHILPSMQEEWQPHPVYLIRAVFHSELEQTTGVLHAVYL